MDENKIRKITVVQLKEKLKDMRAETTGLKQVLVSRLLKEIEKKQKVNEDEDDEVEEEDEEETEEEDEEETEEEDDEEDEEEHNEDEKVIDAIYGRNLFI
jgi:cobalamin biosynthesis protein CobT